MASMTGRKHSFKGWVLDHESSLNPHCPLASLGFIFCLLHNLIIHAATIFLSSLSIWPFSGRHKDKSFKPNEAGLLFLHRLQQHCGTHSQRVGRRLKSQVGFNRASPTCSQFSRSRTPSQDYEAGAGERLLKRNEHPVYTLTLSHFLWPSFSDSRDQITELDGLTLSFS